MDAVRNYRHLLTGKLLDDARNFIARKPSTRASTIS